MTLSIQKTLATLGVAVVLLAPMAAFAQITSPGSGVNSPGQGTVSPGQGVNSPGTFALQNPLGANASSLCGLLEKLLNAIIQIGIPIAVVFLVWAGFLFISARGNETKLKTAKANLLAVIIGIALFLGAWGLGQVLVATVNSLGGSNNPAIQTCS